MPTRLVMMLVLTVAGPLLGGCGSLIVTQQSVEDLRDRRGFTWTTHESDAFTIYAEDGLATPAEMPAIADAADESKRIVLSALDIAVYEPRLSVFLVSSRDRMRGLVGRRTNATGYHTSNSLCIVWTLSGRSGLRHEMVHVIAMNEWGIPERWLNEGLAVDASGPWIGRDVDAVCRILRERGELPTLQDLTGSFDKLTSAVSYPAAGSFVRFLRESYGIETVREVWTEGQGSLTSSTGRPMEELESAWLTRVDQAPIDGVTYDPEALTSRHE